jgi:CHAT domain-containing protein
MNARERSRQVRPPNESLPAVAGSLEGYRVVHFATHGLLASETEMAAGGPSEPALVLTPPDIASQEDDGLLTSGEILQLKLNADWVILSACNTAGGDRTGADAFSGLDRAFFYGALALCSCPTGQLTVLPP